MKLGFLGAGKMATALARGFIHAGLATADGILASDPYETARNAIAKDAGIKTTAANPEVLKFADVILLAVKPDQVNDVLAGARAQFTDRHLLISIAAGVTLARMEAALPANARVVRVMPNTPALRDCSPPSVSPFK
jgi:pyrroline-5-carboxylate reductase